MMRRILFSIAAAMTLAIGSLAVPAPAEAQQLPYIAVSANHLGYGYGQGFTMEQARSNATHQCQTKTSSTCPRSLSVSVHNSWYLVAVRCRNGYSAGASPQGWDRAIDIAASKIGGYGCESVLEE